MELGHLDRICEMVTKWSSKALQTYAVSFIPLDRIREVTANKLRTVQVDIRKGGQGEVVCETSMYQNIFLNELTRWFKEEFFKWVNEPKCGKCGSDTKLLLRNDAASNIPPFSVEVFQCKSCQNMAFFNRFEDAGILLSTRAGRCSEWAQVFTVMCLGLGMRARYVWDVTDHVWTEVYSSTENRWLHCDPCEAAVDSPLMYELGWNKKLSYVIAVGPDDIQDVTWRYSCDHKGVRGRRSPRLDQLLVSKIVNKRKSLLESRSAKYKKYVYRTVIGELCELLAEPTKAGDYGGRTSGSLAWRLARLETTSSQPSFTFTPTPQEINSKQFRLTYCTAADEYSRGSGNSLQVLQGWDKYVYESSNMFRKVELDWKQVYLARREGTSRAHITWRFDVSSSNLVCEWVRVQLTSHRLTTGQVDISLQGDSPDARVTSSNVDMLEMPSVNSKSVTVTLSVSGGQGAVAWQHAQLLRQPLHDTTHLLNVTIKLA